MVDIEVLKAELRAIGTYWRRDWSEFDGRVLRDQINKAIDNFENEKDLYYFRKLLEKTEETDSEYYTELKVSNMNIMGDDLREYLYGYNDAFVSGKGYLKKYIDMYLTHIH